MKTNEPEFDPLKLIRHGNIEASIWQVRERLYAKIARVYWQDDEWKYSMEFDEADLLDLSKAASEAKTWMRNSRPPSAKTISTPHPNQTSRSHVC